jgi:hypothetical protein
MLKNGEGSRWIAGSGSGEGYHLHHPVCPAGFVSSEQLVEAWWVGQVWVPHCHGGVQCTVIVGLRYAR